MNYIGKNIKHLRIKHNMNQKELGELLNVSQTSVAHYEKGTREPNIETLKRLSNIFNESVDRIIGNNKRIDSTSKLSVDEVNKQILEALLNKDNRLYLETFKDNVFNKYSIETIIDNIITKTLYEVGDLWEKGIINEAEEHYISNQVRRVISLLSVDYVDVMKTETALTMSIGNEKHTMGIELIDLYLESLGVKTIYLGNSVPFKSFESFIERYAPKYIFLSITLIEHANHLIGLVEFLIEKFQDKITIAIGGQGLKKTPKPNYDNVYIISNLEEIKELITQ